MKKVSVIIPFYNSQLYLSSTIESVLNQTYKNIELILVDDGSTDDSLNIANRYKNKDLSVVHIENSGVSIARKTGFENSTGDYVFYLDSDDILESHCIEFLVEDIERFNVDVAISSFTIFQNDVPNYDQTNEDSCLLNKLELMKEIIKCDRIQNYFWGKLFKRNIIASFGFPNNNRVWEDITDMVLIFDLCSSGVFSSKSFVFYRANTVSLSRIINDNKLNGFCDALVSKANFVIKNYNQLSHLLCESIFQYCGLVVKYFKKQRPTSIKNYKELMKIYSNCVKHGSFKDKLKYRICSDHKVLYFFLGRK